MNYKLSVRQVGSVSIIDLSGRLDLDNTTGLQRATVRNLLQTGARNILVNLKDAEHIDSGALGELTSSYVSVVDVGGQIKLLNVRGRVKLVLQVTRLYKVFTIFNDEATAINSFAASAAGA